MPTNKLNIDLIIAGLVSLGMIAAFCLVLRGEAVPEWLSTTVIGGGFAALLRAAA